PHRVLLLVRLYFPTRRSSDLISWTCLRVSLPTLFLFGASDPFSTPAARLIRNAVGGLLRMNLNEPSVKMVISAGMTSPMRFAVRSEEHTSELHSPDHLVYRSV